MLGARHAVASSRLFCVLDAAIFCLLFPGIQASTNSPPPPTAAPPLPPVANISLRGLLFSVVWVLGCVRIVSSFVIFALRFQIKQPEMS